MENFLTWQRKSEYVQFAHMLKEGFHRTQLILKAITKASKNENVPSPSVVRKTCLSVSRTLGSATSTYMKFFAEKLFEGQVNSNYST